LSIIGFKLINSLF